MQHLPDVADLSLAEKIGQMLWLGYGNPDALENVNAQARACLTECLAGGMILMGRNVQGQTKPYPPVNLARVRAMNDELQSLARLPLFIATDQEGGNVARLRHPFTTIPSGKIIGDTDDPALAAEAARVTGIELRHIGINTNFAPIADVNSNPANPVIGHRSFSHDAHIAASMVEAQVHGYFEGGVLSCAKHFPGHGDTSVDSHHDLPSLPFSLAEMEARELVPFRAAILAGVPMVMTAHILFPALEPDGLPATMSHAILTGLLRERLGFNGLIVTDCLEMKAVSDHWGTAHGAVLAAKAGADMLLVCHTMARQRETYEALLKAAETGDLPIERVDDAVTRILALKRRLLDLPEPKSAVGSPEHIAISRKIAEKSGVPFVDPEAPSTLGENAVV